jgi:hypothetical protein
MSASINFPEVNTQDIQDLEVRTDALVSKLKSTQDARSYPAPSKQVIETTKHIDALLELQESKSELTTRAPMQSSVGVKSAVSKPKSKPIADGVDVPKAVIDIVEKIKEVHVDWPNNKKRFTAYQVISKKVYKSVKREALPPQVEAFVKATFPDSKYVGFKESSRLHRHVDWT